MTRLMVILLLLFEVDTHKQEELGLTHGFFLQCSSAR